MITRQALLSDFNALLEPALYKDFCYNGLQVEGKEIIQHVAVAVTASLEAIEEAIALKADALFVHHGLFWQGDQFSISGSLKRRLKTLLEAEISLYAYHLPLDGHRSLGNNWKAAVDLNWKNLKACADVSGQSIGVCGSFKTKSIETFRKEIESYYKHDATVALGGQERVSSAMLVSGGGYKFLLEAKKLGIDCFITGNFDEPAWHQAYEEGIHFLALGHTATEEVGPLAISRYLNEIYGLKTTYIPSKNPF